MVPCQTGNYSRKVSYGNGTQCAHDGQETIREGFPMEMIHNSVMTKQETIREKFPMEMIRNGSMPDRKLFAKSFLWKWYTVCPCRTGNCPQKFPMEMIHNSTMPDWKPCKAKEPQKFPRLCFYCFYLSTRWISQQPVTKAMRFGSHTAKVAGMTWPFPRASRKVMMA